MKASELIVRLQDEIAHFGDREIKGDCHCCIDHTLDCDGTFDIGELGWLSDKDGGQYITLICAECAANDRDEHLRGKYESEW